MKYFNGFSLFGEEKLFSNLIEEESITGFSYGAIKAFEYALANNCKKLTLISPAFFQLKDKKFKKLQTLSFKKSQKSYIDNFLKSCAYPSSQNISKYLKLGTAEQLEELLDFYWDRNKLESLVANGCKITIHIGSKDAIVSKEEIENFFKDVADIIVYKGKGHILQ